MRRTYVFLIITLFLLAFPAILHAAGNGIHYKGGMQYHVRYAKLDLPETSIASIGSGLGGRAAFNISPHLRIGGMGFRSHWTYSTDIEKSNFVEIGFGGISLEYVISFKLFAITAGFCGGGGRVNYLHSISRNNPFSVVRYESKTTMIVQPMISTEYKLTEKISAAVMFDWLYAKALPVDNHFAPAIHLGILFGR
jgi:hypothetical protein